MLLGLGMDMDVGVEKGLKDEGASQSVPKCSQIGPG